MNFEYKCTTCGLRKERPHGPGDARDGDKCPECSDELKTVRK